MASMPPMATQLYLTDCSFVGLRCDPNPRKPYAGLSIENPSRG